MFKDMFTGPVVILEKESKVDSNTLLQSLAEEKCYPLGFINEDNEHYKQIISSLPEGERTKVGKILVTVGYEVLAEC